MTLAIPDHIVWQNVVGDLVVFDAQEGTYHALNGSAAAIWREISAGKGEGTIAAALAEACGAALADVTRDVGAFVADAVAKGLLVRTPA